MPRIHPTTIIEGDVQLADSVEIGPWCCLKGPITVGEGTKLLRRVELYGPLTMGQANVVYPNACLGFAPQDLKFDAADAGAGTVIGSHNVFREGVTIHRATGAEPTTVGDHNYFMVNTHVAHDCRVGSRTMFANGALIGGHAVVMDHAILGGNCAVHQFCRVGRFAMISGVTAVTADVPPFTVVFTSKCVEAINRVGLRRAGLQPHIDPLLRAFSLLYRERLSRPSALARIDAELGHDPLCREFVEFIRSSKRGICNFGQVESGK